MELNQYQIILVSLDPTVGSEIKKTRHCVIISPDEMNRNLNTVTIAPLTSKSKSYPTRIKTYYNNRESWIIIDQIRTIDKSRILSVLDKISIEEIQFVKTVLRETFID